MRTSPLAEYRCACGKLLFKGVVRTTRIEIKCKRCGALSSFGPEEREQDLERYGIIAAKDGTIMAVSDTVTRILGYRPDELRSMNLRDLRAYDRDGETPPSLEGAVSEERHRGKDGLMVTVRVRKERAGSQEGMSLYLCDVPSAAVFNDAPVGASVHRLVLETDPSLRVRHADVSLAGLIGASPYALIGTNMLALMDEGSAARYRAMLSQGAQPFVLEDVALFGAGEERRFRVHAIPVSADDGALRGHTLLFEEGSGR